MATGNEMIEAVQQGNAERVRSLLAGDRALARARDDAGVSAVLHARYRMRQDLAELLAEAAAPLDIFEAAALGHLERVRELVDADPSLASAYSGDGFYPLGLAAFFRHPEMVRFLLERGADVKAVARNGMKVTALHAGTAARSVDICGMLLERGADPNAQQQGGWTALHAAAHHGNIGLTRLLLDSGADPKVTNDEGKTAADIARAEGHGVIAELIEAKR